MTSEPRQPRRDRSQVEAAERAFFAEYYAGGAFHPVGMELRLAREFRWVRRMTGGRRLGQVLSVGCGDGRFERRLAACADHVLGIDLSPQAVAAADSEARRLGYANLEFRCQSLFDLEWDRSFDAVFCLALLHHLPEQELPEFLRQVYAHLRPQGWLFTHDPNRRGVLRHLGRWVLGARYHRYHSPHERELDPDEIARLVRDAGFAKVQVGYLDHTLIPSMYLLARGPAWPLRLCLALDWLWCRSPLRRWSSAFTIAAQR
ncbi:MAG: class I SAM-dependent methyltransferase [Pirellulales bacterium]|nr:class I SAM-dependent methyltransferase [Pirellulales bacterium]